MKLFNEKILYLSTLIKADSKMISALGAVGIFFSLHKNDRVIKWKILLYKFQIWTVSTTKI